MCLIIGLTGGIVSGKTTVANMFQKLGAKIIDADKIGHQIILPRKPAWEKIIQEFGHSILREDLTIDRKKLGLLVFSNQKLLEKLNKITHPEIKKAINQKISDFKLIHHHYSRIMIIEVPLLFETGMEHLMDKIILVSLSEKEQIRRLSKRNGFDKDESLKRIKSQMSNKIKAGKADYIIDTNQSLEMTKKQVNEVWLELLKLN